MDNTGGSRPGHAIGNVRGKLHRLPCIPKLFNTAHGIDLQLWFLGVDHGLAAQDIEAVKVYLVLCQRHHGSVNAILKAGDFSQDRVIAAATGDAVACGFTSVH